MYISRSTALRLREGFHRIMSVSQNSSMLLSVALLFMVQLLPSTRATPISCKNNSRESEKFKNCAELYKSGQTISGVYTIQPDSEGAFNVYCDQTTAGGGWTVIQKRQNGSVDFNRALDNYTNGFGNFLIPEFWLGLKKIYRLTQNKTENKLRVELGVAANETVLAEYEWFSIGNETANYKLRIGSFSSPTNSTDSLSRHNGMFFRTWNKPSADRGCDLASEGGWWYVYGTNGCTIQSNLNGIYPYRGSKYPIYWANLTSRAAENNPLTTEMKIRPVDFLSWVNEEEGFC